MARREGGILVKFYSSSSSINPWFRFVSLTLVLSFGAFTLASPAWSQDTSTAAPAVSDSEGGNASSAGMQAAAALSTLLYLPFKAAFAIGGGIVGGLAYAFSGGNEQAAKSIWNT